MTEALNYIVYLAQSGLGNLASYLAAHVLLCLLPAFFIAGALVSLVPREAITRFLGRDAPKYVSYPAAAVGGFVLAVCSCTIMPLFAGIYKKGAGLGPAIAFLFVGPAINILALTYTGVAIGLDIAVARIVLSIVFGIGIGLIMALIFRKDDALHNSETNGAFSVGAKVGGRTWAFLLLLLAVLIVGTLQVGPLTHRYAHVTLPIHGMDRFQDLLHRWVPFDPARGEEGISAQGAILIVLLMLIALAAWRGLDKVDQGTNRWTWASLGLIALTLVVAAMKMAPHAGGLDLYFTGKMFGVTLAMAGLWYIARTRFADSEIQEWLWETWRFVKQIFPLLLVGVFAVGVIRNFIQPEWIEAIAGSNTVFGNLVGVLFGVFMYFPTLVEVPIAQMFMNLGMHRGPLLAYLMADPELSLQSILITASVIGKTRAWIYVAWVTLFSTLAGLIYGAWVGGASAWVIAGYLAAVIAILGAGLALVNRREGRRTLAAHAPHAGE